MSRRLCILLCFVLYVHSDSLFFRACTSNPNRVLLCINECEADAPRDDEAFYSTRQVVLDFLTGTAEIADESKDTPIKCPNLDNSISKQPHPTISAKCTGNRTLVWELKYDLIGSEPITIVTKVEDITKSALWYNAFFFITNTTYRLYFIMEGSDHRFNHHYGIAMHMENRENWAWTIDGEPGLSDYVLAMVMYENSDQESPRCTVQQGERKIYPVLLESIKLVAFPDSKNEMWYKYNDTGLYRFSKSGLIDTRLNSIIEVKDMSVTLHNYVTGEEKTMDIGFQVAQYRIDRPLAVRPSMVIFSISFVVVVVLVISEVLTQRRARLNLKSTKKDDEFELNDALLNEVTGQFSRDDDALLSEVQGQFSTDDEDEESITEIK